MAEKLSEGAGAGAVKHNKLPSLSAIPVPTDISAQLRIYVSQEVLESHI